jgi:hypothetical protein
MNQASLSQKKREPTFNYHKSLLYVLNHHAGLQKFNFITLKIPSKTLKNSMKPQKK